MMDCRDHTLRPRALFDYLDHESDVGVISGAIKYIVLDFDLSTLQEVSLA